MIHRLGGSLSRKEKKEKMTVGGAPLPKGAKRTDKGLRQRSGNSSTFSGPGREVKVEKKRSEKQEEGVPEDRKREFPEGTSDQ